MIVGTRTIGPILRALIIFCLAAVLGSRTSFAGQPFEVQYIEQPGSGQGFYDPTFGPMRRLAFNYAVGIWSQSLEGTIPIRVKASFEDFGNATTLGQAATARRVPNVTGGLPDTVYPAALASQLLGVSVPAASGEFAGFHLWAKFNTQITGFYYGTDGNPGDSQIDFVSVALHELGHGLGFYDSTDPSTGELADDIDVFTRYYISDFFGLFIFDPFTTLTDTQRYVVISAGEVYFDGPRVRSFALLRGGSGVSFEGFSEVHTGGAPPPPSTDPPPSSVLSHWHFKHSPNMTMEPSTLYGEGYPETFFGSFPLPKPGDLVLPAFFDVGWQFNSPLFPSDPVWPPIVPSGSPVTKSIPVTNMRIAPVNLNSATITGPHAGEFSIMSGGAPAVISGHTFRNIRVALAPTSIGIKKADLVLQMSGGQVSTATIHLLGYGRGADVDGDRIADTDETLDLDSVTPGTQNPFNPANQDSTSNNFTSSPDNFIDGWNDWDNDGMNNEDEFTFGYNSINAASVGTPSATDTDGDGVSDAVESADFDPVAPGVQNPFDAFLGDSTGNNGQNAPDDIPDGQNDYDADGLTNSVEAYFGINPILFDTDGDGFGDGAEAVAGTLILDPGSRPPTDLMWVDFAATGIEAGIQTYPFNTLAEVIALLDPNGTINIKGDSTDVESNEIPTILTPMTLQSINGVVRIGITP